MKSWRMRAAYGRGAARVAVPIPRLSLEMAPQRPAVEIAAALSPLYLAVLLPALCDSNHATAARLPWFAHSSRMVEI